MPQRPLVTSHRQRAHTRRSAAPARAACRQRRRVRPALVARLGVEQHRAQHRRRSPRTPAPLFVERRAPRARRRPGSGLLVTRRWISWRPMNGADVRVGEEHVERAFEARRAPSAARRRSSMPRKRLRAGLVARRDQHASAIAGRIAVAAIEDAGSRRRCSQVPAGERARQAARRRPGRRSRSALPPASFAACRRGSACTARS